MKKYSKTTKSILAVIGTFFLSYFCVSFVNADIDPYSWHMHARALMIVVWVMISLIPLLIISEAS